MKQAKAGKMNGKIFCLKRLTAKADLKKRIKKSEKSLVKPKN